MASSGTNNVYQEMKDAFKSLQKEDLMFGHFSPVDLKNSEEIQKRGDAIKSIMKRWSNAAKVTYKSFEESLNVKAQPTTKKGKERLVLFMSKLKKDLAEEEYLDMRNSCKDTDFMDHLENSKPKDPDIHPMVNEEFKGLEVTEEKKVRKSIKNMSLNEGTEQSTTTTVETTTTSTTTTGKKNTQNK